MRPRDPFTFVLVLLLYVLPFGAAVVVLFAVGLPVLAVALLVIEAGVVLAIVIARRPPAPPTGRRRPGWVVPVTMVGVLVAMAGVTVLLTRYG